MDQDSSVDLLEKWRGGDEHAARILFDRYANRLIALARTRLSEKIKRRVEPEDVVQSAYRSFFRKAGQDEYTLDKSGDFWRLLVAITLSKLRGQVEYHTAKKRGVYSEESFAGDHSVYGVPPEVTARDPRPSDAAAVVEELQHVMQRLEPLHRQILELALQDLSIEQIAEQVHRSARTIRRSLQQIRDDLEERLIGSD